MSVKYHELWKFLECKAKEKNTNTVFSIHGIHLASGKATTCIKIVGEMVKVAITKRGWV